MIHKLYVNIAGWSKLDFDHDKKVILDTMMYDNKKCKHTYYMIVSEDDRVPPVLAPEVAVLRNQEDIDKYINIYNERKQLDEMSCLELKRSILDKQDIKIKRLKK